MAATQTIRLHDKTFRLSIPHDRLVGAIGEVAQRINRDYARRACPLFLGVLNGSFMYMAELLQHIDFTCEVSFVKLASYNGTSSTGAVQELIGLTNNLQGRHIIIVEDIVDTGGSIEHLIRSLIGHNPASISVSTLLFKPEAYKKEHKIDYYAMAIPDKFIVGYGLDYDQLGRNLKDIYELAAE